MRYKKKPIEIDAMQWTGENREALSVFMGQRGFINGKHVEIFTLEGVMSASPGDWIIRGIVGELYPCTQYVFEQSYEKV